MLLEVVVSITAVARSWSAWPKRHGVPLRQSYARLGKGQSLRLRPPDEARASRDQEIRRLKTYLRRVFRDLRRKLEARLEVAEPFAQPLAWVEWMLVQ